MVSACVVSAVCSVLCNRDFNLIAYSNVTVLKPTSADGLSLTDECYTSTVKHLLLDFSVILYSMCAWYPLCLKMDKNTSCVHVCVCACMCAVEIITQQQ